jgi:hypothetical protein
MNLERDSIFLPGLQREFVWGPSQIESLFDSLIRQYPVGIITIWKTQSSLIKNYTTYNFLTSHVSSDHYPPNEIRQRFQRYNNEAKGENSEFLIIDGQQRLNSIYIGICGKIAEYTGGAGRTSSEAKNWEAKKLCVNLFGHPSHEGDEIAGDYQFKFRSTGELGGKENFGYDRRAGEHRLWVPVGEFWVSENDDSDNQTGQVMGVDDLREEIIDERLPEAPISDTTLENNNLEFVSQSVGRDVRDILDGELDTKNVKKPRSEIPEIFQRLNREGQRPERYQLFLSRLMTRWPYLEDGKDINPRKKIEQWVDEFKQEFNEYEKQIHRRLFIRYSLALINTDLTQSGLNTVSTEELEKLREKWTYTDPTTKINGYEWFKESLEKAFKTVIQSGIRPKLFDTMPFFVLIAVFYYQNPGATVDKNRNQIFQFISKLLLLSQSGRRVLRFSKYRIFRRLLFNEAAAEDYDQFPGDMLLECDGLTLSKSDITSVVMDSRYDDTADTAVFGGKGVIAILGLLEESYTIDETDIRDYEIDHIYPQSKGDQISQSTTQDVDLDRVGNLQLLPRTVNKSKGSKLPEDWYDEIDPTAAENLQQINQFPDIKPQKENAAEFIEKREEHIVTYLTEKYVN